MLAVLHLVKHRELPAAPLQESGQEGTICWNLARRGHQTPGRLLTRTGTHLPGLVPLRALLPGLGLLPVWRFVQGTLQVFVEVALQVQGVVSNFHFQVVQGALLGRKNLSLLQDVTGGGCGVCMFVVFLFLFRGQCCRHSKPPTLQ